MMGSIQENQNVPLSARHFFKRLWIACTITFTTKLIDISRLWDLNEKKVEELLCLLVFGVLQVKDRLDRTDMNKDKNGKTFTRWNVASGTLPGSKRIVHVLDHWLNNSKVSIKNSAGSFFCVIVFYVPI